MSFFSITGTSRERILWPSVQQLPELTVKIQLPDDDQLYPAIQSLQKSKPCRILTMIQRSKENKGPSTNQRKKWSDTWLQKSTCLDRCPAVGGVSIAGEEEVTGLHGTHGPVELKGSYSYELPLLVWFVVCTLTFYFCGWVTHIFSPATMGASTQATSACPCLLILQAAQSGCSL